METEFNMCILFLRSVLSLYLKFIFTLTSSFSLLSNIDPYICIYKGEDLPIRNIKKFSLKIYTEN